MTCTFCGYQSDNIDDFEEDFQHHAGYWCPYCDGFTYFENHGRRNQFILLLEDPQSGQNSTKTMIEKKIPSRVSPLRYPGGKSKVIDQIYSLGIRENLKIWAEPYAGGASVGLALLLAGYVEELYINDIDTGIYALFQVICNDPGPLYERIDAFTPSLDAYKRAQKALLSDYEGLNLLETAWVMLIVNRLSYSGICKANCMRDPAARWNPKGLIKRMERIHACASKIHVSNMDALAFIEEMYWQQDTTLFVDPPYFGKGKQLYKHYYKAQDHDNLAFLLDELYKGMPGADVIVTYDMSQYIRSIYQYPDELILSRCYSIAN